MLIKASRIRLFSLVVALVLSLPLPPGIFSGFYIWLSPFVMLNALIAGRGFVVFSLLGITVLLLAFYNNLFFCRYLCPAGVLCDAVSSVPRKRQKKAGFPSISKSFALISIILSVFGIPVLIIADPLNLFNAFFDFTHKGFSAGTLLKTTGLMLIVLVNLAVPHLWCQKLCPLGGLQHILTDIRRLISKAAGPREPVFSRKRRYLLSGILGVGAGFLLPRIIKPGPQAVLRPPGSLPDDELKMVCSRCGNCLKSCPTNIIEPWTGTGDVMNIFTPRLRFSHSYCLPECRQCGSVCPTGAIRPFKTEDKKQLFIGTAHVTTEVCLLTQNKECNRCRLFCEFDAVNFAYSANFSVIPVINEELCVGCGACQVACPTRAIDVRPPGQPAPADEAAIVKRG